MRVLLLKYSRDTLTIEIPKCFERLKGNDANFEMVSSNTIQPVRLSFRHNEVTRSIAVIFINTHCNGLNYKNVLVKGKQTEQLFKDVFEFNEVWTYYDLTKEKIIEILLNLHSIAVEFESGDSKIKEPVKPLLAISISWIGHKL